jgi:4,5-DOPA dioxygenase extradiol
VSVAHVPPIFVAHGPEASGIDPDVGAELGQWARQLPKPRGILAVSAHWQADTLARGTTASPVPLIPTRASAAPAYRPPGAPELAYEVHALLPVDRFPKRGLDHGVWDPLRHLYPDADVPVLELATPIGATSRRLYSIGRKLGALAARGFLLLASGAITNNDAEEAKEPNAPVPPWAREFDAWITNHLADAEIDALLAWRVRAPHARKAHPTTEHIDPLFVVAGAASLYENAVGYPIRGFSYGTRNRRCVQFGR